MLLSGIPAWWWKQYLDETDLVASALRCLHFIFYDFESFKVEIGSKRAAAALACFWRRAGCVSAKATLASVQLESLLLLTHRCDFWCQADNWPVEIPNPLNYPSKIDVKRVFFLSITNNCKEYFVSASDTSHRRSSWNRAGTPQGDQTCVITLTTTSWKV